MKYQKIINFLDNTPTQPSKCGTKYSFEINDDSRVIYNKDRQIKFKTSMLKSGLFGYSDAHILVKRTITTAPIPPPVANPNNNDKEVLFKNCAPFTDCTSDIYNTQINNAKDIDVVMPI